VSSVPEVIAAYAVHGGTTVTVELEDVSDPNMVALWLIEDNPVGVSLCHECGHEISGPEIGELLSFTVNGVDYERDDETGHWVASGDGGREEAHEEEPDCPEGDPDCESEHSHTACQPPDIPAHVRAAGWDAFEAAIRDTTDGPQVYGRVLDAIASAWTGRGGDDRG
jgi:hypothetical protein